MPSVIFHKACDNRYCSRAACFSLRGVANGRTTLDPGDTAQAKARGSVGCEACEAGG